MCLTCGSGGGWGDAAHHSTAQGGHFSLSQAQLAVRLEPCPPPPAPTVSESYYCLVLLPCNAALYHCLVLLLHSTRTPQGNYTQYVAAKSEREALQWTAYEKQQKEIDKLQDMVRRLSGEGGTHGKTLLNSQFTSW